MEEKVVTFGEIMMRLQPPSYERFLQAKSFDVVFGGGEANVAVSLAQFGVEASFVTKLPDNEIGDACFNEIRKWGVDTSFIARGGERLGLYFCEKGFSQRASKVIYDRAYSAISQARFEDFNWDEIFQGVEWFHFTGITPALSKSCADIVMKACQVAKSMGITVSCDLNYRKKLWSKDKAAQVMEPLMQYVDVLIANEEDAESIFSIKATGNDVLLGQLNEDGYKDVCKQLVNRFGFDKVAITLRESVLASQNNWSAILYSEGQFYTSRKYNISIIDRVGGGDSFGAGLIYSILKGYENADMIEFATAASCIKHTIEGDFNIASVKEVQQLMMGDGSGRVQR